MNLINEEFLYEQMYFLSQNYYTFCILIDLLIEYLHIEYNKQKWSLMQ